MQYKIRRVDPPARDAIEHGLFGKGGAKLGSTWDNHLYIARQKMANGWRYFYSQAELRAAQAKQAGQNTVNAVKNSNVVKGAQRKVQTMANERNSKRAYKDSIKNYNQAANTHGVSSAQARAAADKVRKGANDYAQSIVDNNKKYDPLENLDKYNKSQYKTAREVAGKVYGASASVVIGAAVSEKIRNKLKDVKDSVDKGKDFLDRAINSGKDKASSAVDKAREAATKAADKAQAAADKAKKAAEDARKVAEEAVNRAKAAIPETKAKEEAPKPVEKKSQPEPAQKKESSYPEKPDNVSEEYWEELHGPDPNKKSNNQASKPMDIKKAPDEYIEDLYSNSKKNDGSGVSPELELEYNYRQASNQAEYLGRVTDTKSDAAEAA
ncbi:MAG: hypothetical protein J6Y02_11945 [Pseudobutyrivibrio sp.]|nr:hypothetical protein [Pseudobutyrivibrio sp.]